VGRICRKRLEGYAAYVVRHIIEPEFQLVCPSLQFYTKCAVIVLICGVLTAHLCSCNLQQCEARGLHECFKKLCMSLLNIVQKLIGWLLACSVPANFHYRLSPIVFTTPPNWTTEDNCCAYYWPFQQQQQQYIAMFNCLSVAILARVKWLKRAKQQPYSICL